MQAIARGERADFGELSRGAVAKADGALVEFTEPEEISGTSCVFGSSLRHMGTPPLKITTTESRMELGGPESATSQGQDSTALKTCKARMPSRKSCVCSEW